MPLNFDLDCTNVLRARAFLMEDDFLFHNILVSNCILTSSGPVFTG